MLNICCPRCGNPNIEEYSSESIKDLEKALPRYKYPACRASFGRAPGGKYKKDIIKSLELGIKGILKGELILRLSATENGFLYFVESKRDKVQFCSKIQEIEWNSFFDTLFDQMFLADWKEVYYSRTLGNAQSWNLDVSFKKRHSLHFKGINGYPPYWDNLLLMIEPFFKRAGIEL